MRRERFFLAMASEDAFGVPEVERTAAQQKKTLRIKLLRAKVNEVPKV